MEILDLYNDNGEKLNETVIRGEKFDDNNKNIMLAVAFLKNDEEKYLIQKTSKEKGGKYASTGGHVKHNEDSLTTIKKEIKEELNITVLEKDLKYICTFKYPNRPCLFSVYMIHLDSAKKKDIKLQKEEVEKIDFFTADEIMELIKSELFLESHAYIFKNYINAFNFTL